MTEFTVISFMGIGTTCDKCGKDNINKIFSADMVLTHINCPDCGHKETINLLDEEKQ